MKVNIDGSKIEAITYNSELFRITLSTESIYGCYHNEQEPYGYTHKWDSINIEWDTKRIIEMRKQILKEKKEYDLWMTENMKKENIELKRINEELIERIAGLNTTFKRLSNKKWWKF